MATITLSSLLNSDKPLSNDLVNSLTCLLSSRCSDKTKWKVAYGISKLRGRTWFSDRINIEDNDGVITVDYVPGQSYTDEIRRIREDILGYAKLA